MAMMSKPNELQKPKIFVIKSKCIAPLSPDVCYIASTFNN